MYKVIIIDDEYLTRLGLEKTVDWAGHECQVVATACNGAEGFKLIQEKNPDLVITDIRMPLMTGVDLVEKLDKSGFKGEIIVLTAYKDFNYAVKTYNSGIFSYVLKPIENNELLKIVDKAILRLKENRSDQNIKDSFASSSLEAKLAKVSALINGESTVDFDKVNKELDINVPSKGQLILIKEDKSSEKDCSFTHVAGEEIKSAFKVLNVESTSFDLGSSSLVFIPSLDKDTALQGLMNSIILIEKKTDRTFGFSFSSYLTYEEVNLAYINDNNLIKKKLLFGFNTIETESIDNSLSYKHYASIQAFYKLLSIHYAEPISVSSISEMMGVSESYLMHLLKKSLDKTFNNIVTEYRISLAKRMILEGQYRINEIAYKIGYPDEKYFSKVFKKATGVNPSKFK